MTPSSSLPGSKLLLVGDAGTGKTTSIASWLAAGITPFCIFTEPSFEVLGDQKWDNALSKMHWVYLPPASSPWTDLIDSAKKINTMSFKQLCQLDDINKRSYHQFIDFLIINNNFKCSHCGKEFGDVSKWGTDRALVWDSLSGLSYMAMRMMVGTKPVKDQGDWGVAMDNLENVLMKVTTDTRAWFQLISHMEPEKDEVSGAILQMPSTLGRKLAPKLAKMFSDVVVARRVADKFMWSTVEPNAVQKARNLDYKGDLPPTVVPIVESWKRRGGLIESGESPVATAAA